MPTRTLKPNEWRIRTVGATHQVFIHRCTNPKSQEDVDVKIKCVYIDGRIKNFDDNVNLIKTEVEEKGVIKTYGKADHATPVGRNPVDKAKTVVTITWK